MAPSLSINIALVVVEPASIPKKASPSYVVISLFLALQHNAFV